MSIQSAPYYWVQCDGCGERAEYYGGEIGAWPEPEQAVELLDDDAFWDLGVDAKGRQTHHCPNCAEPDDEDDVAAGVAAARTTTT